MVRPGRKRRRPAVGPCHKVQRSGRHPHRSGGRGARPEKPAPGIRRPRRRCGACRCRAGRMPRRPPSVEVRPRARIRPPGGILWPGGLPRCLPLAIWRPPRPSVAPSLGGTMRTSPWRRGLCRRGSGSTSPTSTPSPAGATISPTRRPARRRPSWRSRRGVSNSQGASPAGRSIRCSSRSRRRSGPRAWRASPSLTCSTPSSRISDARGTTPARNSPTTADGLPIPWAGSCWRSKGAGIGNW